MKQKTKHNPKPRKMKKFRSQILAHWLINTYEPCKVADIGGGKGLLSYVLNKAGFQSTVIDPVQQKLPEKFTDLNKNKNIIPEIESVPYIAKPYTKEMAKDYDLLVGLHAHGSMMSIIDAAVEFDKDILILPCCVIDEPIEKLPDINWRESLKEYAKKKGLYVKEIQFNFMGKNIALYTDRFLKTKGSLSDKDKKEYIIFPMRFELCLLNEKDGE
jgi:hypothetical protein